MTHQIDRKNVRPQVDTKEEVRIFPGHEATCNSEGLSLKEKGRGAWLVTAPHRTAPHRPFTFLGQFAFCCCE
jgi:hypothetical protein